MPEYALTKRAASDISKHIYKCFWTFVCVCRAINLGGFNWLFVCKGIVITSAGMTGNFRPTEESGGLKYDRKQSCHLALAIKLYG